jgi:hypothetical protein
MESIRAKKSAKFAELRKKKGTREFEEAFLKYVPGENVNKSNKTPNEPAVAKEVPNKTRKIRKSQNILQKLLFPL